jgi:hypothetical protein
LFVEYHFVFPRISFLGLALEANSGDRAGKVLPHNFSVPVLPLFSDCNFQEKSKNREVSDEYLFSCSQEAP